MIELLLVGGIVPKARPRLTHSGRAYLPDAYRQWKAGSIDHLKSQYQGDRLLRVRSISIELHGKHSRRGDSDNIAGSILDALVQAEILAGDNLVVVPKLSIELHHSKVSPTANIVIVV